MSEEQAAAAEPVPEAKEPITLRVRDQVSIIALNLLVKRICMSCMYACCLENYPQARFRRVDPAPCGNQWSDEIPRRGNQWPDERKSQPFADVMRRVYRQRKH